MYLRADRQRQWPPLQKIRRACKIGSRFLFIPSKLHGQSLSAFSFKITLCRCLTTAFTARRAITFKLKEQDYLRKMLSRRQSAGFVMRRCPEAQPACFLFSRLILALGKTHPEHKAQIAIPTQHDSSPRGEHSHPRTQRG